MLEKVVPPCSIGRDFLKPHHFFVSPFASRHPSSALSWSFHSGWPNASADLKLLHANTLQLGKSPGKLGRSVREWCQPFPDNLDGYSTPSPSQKAVNLNEKPHFNDNQVTPYHERSCPEALFIIRYSLPWEEVLNAMVDNIKTKSLNIEERYVEKNFGNRYKCSRWW